MYPVILTRKQSLSEKGGWVDGRILLGLDGDMSKLTIGCNDLRLSHVKYAWKGGG